MKKLNLKSFSTAVLLCAAFVVLPPYSVYSMPLPMVSRVELKARDLQTYLNTNNINVSGINIKAIAADPNAINEIKVALALIKNLTDNVGLQYNSSEVEYTLITANAPIGFDIKTPPYQPSVININAATELITPNIAIGPLIWICFEIVVVIVILGVACYVVVKVCKWIKKVISDREQMETNILDEAISFNWLPDKKAVSPFKRAITA